MRFPRLNLHLPRGWLGRRTEGYELLETTPSSSVTPKLPHHHKGKAAALSTKRRIFAYVAYFLLFDALVIVTVIALSYAFPLPHPYLSQPPMTPQTANPDKKKVFIAANIVNADLIRGAWGDSVLGLIDLLGAENAYLSIYENDSGNDTKSALKELEKRVTSDASIVSGTIPLATIPHTVVTGSEQLTYIDRIEYLSVVRNNALAPLSTLPAFDKILFLNDVYFEPSEAVHLMFDTNNGSFSAACAMDFRDPFKYYDTFATRDIAGNELGIPIYPWFAPGESQDAVRRHDKEIPVTSCWGGMVAFDARPFQTPEKPVRFRHSGSTEWEGAECCLVHSDIRQATLPASQRLSDQGLPVGDPRGTYVNQYVRTMYDGGDWHWREFGRRVQWAFFPFHRSVTWLIGYPRLNKHRLQSAHIVAAGEELSWSVEMEDGVVRTFTETVTPDEMAANITSGDRLILDTNGGYCGTGKCMALIEETRKWYILPHCYSSADATIVSAESWAEGSRRVLGAGVSRWFGPSKRSLRTSDFWDRDSKVQFVDVYRDD